MKISQREARRLKKRVEELESAESRRRNAWASDWPGGVNVWTTGEWEDAARVFNVCRKLGHAVVAVPDGKIVRFYALPLASERK